MDRMHCTLMERKLRRTKYRLYCLKKGGRLTGNTQTYPSHNKVQWDSQVGYKMIKGSLNLLGGLSFSLG